jgi:signal transduction histidine kinase
VRYSEAFLTGFSTCNVLIDVREIAMVISNLLSNALKFTSESITKRVEIEADGKVETIDSPSHPQGGVTGYLDLYGAVRCTHVGEM